MNSGGGKYFWRWRSGFTTLLQLASTTTSKLPLRIASYHGPVGTTRWVTCSPILLHSSINHVPTNLYGWSMLRFRSSNASPSAPASFRRRFASARDFSMSGQYPASVPCSALVAASGEPGNTPPPTVLTLAILASAGAPCHWSTASASARRTRTASNGFFLWLGGFTFPP